MRKLLNKNIFVLIILIFIGLVVHFKSFQMVPYGDDWRFIYNYFTHEEVVANFSPLPGLLAYLAPYGPSALTIGFLYQVFGSKYYIFYLMPLIGKIITSFVIFLMLKNISNELKKRDIIVSFLSAAFFLVGATGIQAIDWAFHINVYISMFIFALGIFFQIRFFNYKKEKDLLLALFFSLFAIVFAPFRFLSVTLMVPLIDLIFLIRNKAKDIFLIILLKNLIFAISIFVFFLIGLFGHSPQDFYSPFPIRDAVKLVMAEPLLSAKTFLHWIGSTIMPFYPGPGINSFITGAVFLLILFTVFSKYRGKYIILGSVLYFIPLFLMWMITPTRIIDSGDRYLPLAFFGLSFLIGVICLYANKFKNIFIGVLLILVLIQALSTMRIYSYWISIGRGADFTLPEQEKIMSHFLVPQTEQKIIYLDFEENPVFLQSIEFGIGYRVAVLSGTKGLDNFPRQLDNKGELVKFIKSELSRGESIDQIVNKIYAFQYKNKVFQDITDTFDAELKKQFSK